MKVQDCPGWSRLTAAWRKFRARWKTRAARGGLGKCGKGEQRLDQRLGQNSGRKKDVPDQRLHMLLSEAKRDGIDQVTNFTCAATAHC